MNAPRRSASHSAPRQRGLDGLRTLAVAAVFLFHAQPSLAPGGFFGVTAFFVLSGYLITGLLLDSLVSRGEVGFIHFWGRRLRRLVPALAVLVVVCVIYSQTRLDPPHDHQNTVDLVRGLLWSSNWFQVAGSVEPLGFANHLWSLAIEAQFYLLWPLVLWAIWLLSGGRAAAGADRVPGRLVLILGLLTVLAALWRMWLYSGPDDHRRVYYGLDTNLDGLLLGATWAACRRWSKDVSSRLTVAAGVLAPLAVATLVWSVVHFRVADGEVFTMGIPLVAVATLVLVAASARPWGVSVVLQWWPLVAVGTISYAVYLWHWPTILILNPYRARWGNNTVVVLEAVVSLALAVLSWFLIERPAGRVVHRRVASGVRHG